MNVSSAGRSVGVSDSVPQDENASTVVVAFGFDVRVGEKEHGKNDDDNIPSREYETEDESAYAAAPSTQYNVRESVGDRPHLIRGVPCREGHHGGNLQQTDLECIRRTNLHAMNFYQPTSTALGRIFT